MQSCDKSDNRNMSEENIDEEDVNETKGDESDQVNIEDSLESVDSEIEDDETEIIYQRFLENHKKKENELKKKESEENFAVQMQNFKFVSTYDVIMCCIVYFKL